MSQVPGDRTAQAEADFVDANDLAVQIHQRAARIAAINRGIMADPTDQRADVFAIQSHTAEVAE